MVALMPQLHPLQEQHGSLALQKARCSSLIILEASFTLQQLPGI